MSGQSHTEVIDTNHRLYIDSLVTMFCCCNKMDVLPFANETHVLI